MYGENHVSRPARMKLPDRRFKFMRNRQSRRISSKYGTVGLPKHWSSKMDAEALARMRDELEAMRVLDEIGVSWGF